MMLVDRLIWILTGIAWAGSTVLQLGPARYWDPGSVLDYTAVFTYTAAWCLLGPSVILLTRDTTKAARRISMVAAAGAILTGVANGVEDGLGVPSAGAFYVIGFFVGWLALLPLALAIGRAKLSRLALVPLLLFSGIILLTSVGGFLILGLLTALAVRPEWFVRRGPERGRNDEVDTSHPAP